MNTGNYRSNGDSGLLFIFLLIAGVVALDVYVQVMPEVSEKAHPLLSPFLQVAKTLPLLRNPWQAHGIAAGMILFMVLQQPPFMSSSFDVKKNFLFPFTGGLALLAASIVLLPVVAPYGALWYGGSYVLGLILVHGGCYNAYNHWRNPLGRDIWNEEGESFMQNRAEQRGADLFYFPYQFKYKGATLIGKAYADIYRAILICGTPKAGKTFSFILPLIRFHLQRGHSLCLYDFKSPDLTKITWHYYKKYKDTVLRDHRFYKIDFGDVRNSNRCNPILPKYITSLNHAMEISSTFMNALMKADAAGGQNFFSASAINFVAACIYFLAKYEKGKYCTIPHLIALLCQNIAGVFELLSTNPYLVNTTSTFKDALDNKAMDQLMGQIATAKTYLTPLDSVEAAWILGCNEVENDIDLKISGPRSVLCLASKPELQKSTSAYYSLILAQLITQVNAPGNNPVGIVVDEFPTIYIHEVNNLIATARSNQVSVALGLQELTQLYSNYPLKTAKNIIATMGNIFCGSVNMEETARWIETLMGSKKMASHGVSEQDSRVSGYNHSEQLHKIMPQSKIMTQQTGNFCGRLMNNGHPSGIPQVFSGKILPDGKAIAEEKKTLPDWAETYTFGSASQKEEILLLHYQTIQRDVRELVKLHMQEQD